MEYTDLRNKSIFDFTRDEKILKKVFPECIFEDYSENPKEFIDNCKEWFQPRAIVGDMIEFAKYTNNKEFYSSLENEFKEQYPNDFRRIGDPIYSV